MWRKPRLLRALAGLACLLVVIANPHAARGQAGEWTWVGGPQTPSADGDYGQLGQANGASQPGARQSAPVWRDSAGDLWLFGGNGYDSSHVGGGAGPLNDLWMYDISTNEWTWVGGSSAFPLAGSDSCEAGVFGVQGVADSGNTPGGNFGGQAWTDKNGNFWLFSGSQCDSTGTPGNLNDLWMYNPTTNQWTWVAGPDVNSVTDHYLGVYGVMSEASASNTPGDRVQGATWTDLSGRFWLFGGQGSDSATAAPLPLNDLWMYDSESKEWTWKGGPDSVTFTGLIAGNPGVYAAQGSLNASNQPGSRAQATTWTDSDGNLWMFGGLGNDSTTSDNLLLNDLWMYSISSGKWNWVGGPSTVTQGLGMPGVYGTQGSESSGNWPGGRNGANAWVDGSGNVWLFGGNGYDINGELGFLDDLWMYNPITGIWTWVDGSNTASPTGVFGAGGTASAANIPPPRAGAMGWKDTGGNFWLFAGLSDLDVINDLWRFNAPEVMTGTATPTFSLPSGTYTTVQSVNISDATPNAMIFYTTDGTTPTTLSTVFGGAISVSSTETIEAIAVATGFSESAVASAAYTINLPAATPVISPAAGTYTSTQSVTITDGTPNAIIYYTTNGTTPTASSTPYAGAISVSATETVQAIAVATGFSNSAVASAAYTINLPAATPVISLTAGTYTSTQSVTISDSTPNAIIYYTTNGTTPTASSTIYSGAISVSATETVQAIAVATGFSNSAIASAIYTINLPAAMPVISPAAGTYTSTQSVTIADSTPNATIYYTTNGTTPTASSTIYSAAISVSTTETIQAIAVATGFSNSAVASAAYTINLPAATPVISPAAGTYTSTQGVTIADSTPNATIYYTTNGTTPTASSTPYAGAISVSATETIQAIALATGFSNSAVASAAYTINLPAATPVISLAAGTYTSTQSVTISDSTPNAIIYYTTNGTTPTASSTPYAGSISVSATETVQAIAVATGFSNSAVASAAYTINLPAATPVISPAAGTYTSTQSVTITDSTPNATIYYTTNSTTPTASSTIYSAAISVSATETIQAIAVAPGFSASAVAASDFVVTVVPPSFTLSASPSPLTIQTGSTGSTVITLTSTGGFTGTVNFTCETLPTDMTCSFAPSSLTVPSAGALTTTLSVGTTGTTAATLRDGPDGTFLPEVFVAMILLPLGFTRRILRTRKAGGPWFMCLLLLGTLSLAAAGMVGMTGCGGTSSISTPPGTYNITIDVTSGGKIVPLNLSITVQ